MEQIIKRILSVLNTSATDTILLEDGLVEIDKNKFSKIRIVDSDKSIAFIDGGNIEIISSPSLSLFFNRVYYTIYKKNKRITSKRYEFYNLITTNVVNGSVMYNSEVFFLKESFVIKKYSFESDDPLLTVKGKRAKIGLVGDIIRRFSELIVSSQINSDFIVIDGTLSASYPHEKELLENIKIKNIFGLSKTNDLISSSGKSINLLLYPHLKDIAGVFRANENTSFVKLDINSKHIFRLDYFFDPSEEFLSLLSKNSKDPIFLGYPYGLIEADRFARTMNHEKDILKLKFNTALKKHFPNYDIFITTKDAHNILDNIS